MRDYRSGQNEFRKHCFIVVYRNAIEWMGRRADPSQIKAGEMNHQKKMLDPKRLPQK